MKENNSSQSSLFKVLSIVLGIIVVVLQVLSLAGYYSNPVMQVIKSVFVYLTILAFTIYVFSQNDDLRKTRGVLAIVLALLFALDFLLGFNISIKTLTDINNLLFLLIDVSFIIFLLLEGIRCFKSKMSSKGIEKLGIVFVLVSTIFLISYFISKNILSNGNNGFLNLADDINLIFIVLIALFGIDSEKKAKFKITKKSKQI